MTGTEDPPDQDRELAELEERVAAVLDLPESEQSEAFRRLRDRHPERAAFLERWEQAVLGLDAGMGGRVDPRPERIGSYRILDVLGEGGMGVVYLAEHAGSRERVALKVVREGMDGKHVLPRFEVERRAVEMMDHANIARMIDAGATPEGRPFFALEYVPGMPLTDYCDRQRLGLQERIELFCQVCRGVEHAHQRGVIHRDLKPSNILVHIRNGDPEPKIIDFGVAKALEQRLSDRTLFTEQGRILGTPEYMSPEQAESGGLEINTRSDIYSLGVVLYELLTGNLPFRSADLRNGSYLAMQRRIREEEPQRPSTRCRTVHDADGIAERRRMTRGELIRSLRNNLDWIVLRCLEKDPSRRYASAAALADDLGRHLDGRPVEARSPSAWYRTVHWSRRHRAALLGLAAVVLSIGLSRIWIPGSSDPSVRTTTRFEIPGALVNFASFRDQTDFGGTGQKVLHTMDSSRMGAAGIAIWDSASGVSTPLGIPVDEGWELHSPRWSPDHERIAVLGRRHVGGGEWENGVFVFDPGSGRVHQIHSAPGPEGVHDHCWHPDGTRITCATRRRKVFDLDLSGRSTPFDGTFERSVELGRYSPDGRWLLLNPWVPGSSRDPDLWVVPAGGGRAVRITSMPGRESLGCFGPEGRWVWFLSRVWAGNARFRANVYRVPFDPDTGSATGPVEQVTNHENVDLSDLALVNGGRDLVYRMLLERHEIWFRDSEEDGVASRLLAHGTKPRMAPDGSAVFFLDLSFRAPGLARIPVDGSDTPEVVVSFDRLNLEGGDYDIRRDVGAVVLSGVDPEGPGVFVADLPQPGRSDAGPAAPRRIASPDVPVSPRWSPDGKAIAFCDESRLVVIDAATGRSRQVGTSVWGWEPWTLRWAPDGSAIAAMGYETRAEREDLDSNGVFLVSWPEGRLRRLAQMEGSYSEGLAWHDSGAYLTVVSSDHRHLRIGLDGGPPSVLLNEPEHIEYVGSWRPNGGLLYFYCLGGRDCPGGVHEFDPATRTVRHGGMPFHTVPHWSDDGRFAVWPNKVVMRHFERVQGIR